MDEHDINGAKAIVRYLFRTGLNWYRSPKQKKAWTFIYKSIGGEATTLRTEEALQRSFLKKDEDSGAIVGSIRRRIILLEPPSSDPNIVCLLGMRWNLTATDSKMSLYLHMFGQSQFRCRSTWYRGYRLEMPHKGTKHDYTHVQPVTKISWLPNPPSSLVDPSSPDSFPSLPLRGNSLTTLCAALPVALHGSGILGDLRKTLRGHRTLKHINKFLE